MKYLYICILLPAGLLGHSKSSSAAPESSVDVKLSARCSVAAKIAYGVLQDQKFLEDPNAAFEAAKSAREKLSSQDGETSPSDKELSSTVGLASVFITLIKASPPTSNEEWVEAIGFGVGGCIQNSLVKGQN